MNFISQQACAQTPDETATAQPSQHAKRMARIKQSEQNVVSGKLPLAKVVRVQVLWGSPPEKRADFDALSVAALAALPRGFSATDMAPVASAQVKTDITDMLGFSATSVLIEAIQQTLQSGFEAAGTPFVVIRPFASGKAVGLLTFYVSESKFGALTVSGNQRADAQALAAAFALRTGQSIRFQEVEATAAWLNRNPSRQVSLNWRAGAAPVTTDLQLQVQEATPWDARFSLSNGGSATTGHERVALSLAHNDVLGKGWAASYALSGDLPFKRVQSHAFTLNVPLRPAHSLSVGINVGRTHPSLPAPLDSRGSSAGVGLRYTMELPPLWGMTHSASITHDRKRSDNTLLFSSTPVSNTPYELQTYGAQYNASKNDAWGQTAIAAGFTTSPGSGSRQRRADAALEAARFGATAHFRYANVQVSRQTKLPMDVLWGSSLRMQAANRNLIGSEQLGLAGAQGVRGTQDSSSFTDRGALWRNDFSRRIALEADEESVGDRPNRAKAEGRTQLHASVFVDAGRGRSIQPLPLETTTRLSSVGAGLRLASGDFTLQAELGKPLREAALGKGRPARGTLNVSWAL